MLIAAAAVAVATLVGVAGTGAVLGAVTVAVATAPVMAGAVGLASAGAVGLALAGQRGGAMAVVGPAWQPGHLSTACWHTK